MRYSLCYFPRSGQGDKILKVDHIQFNYDGPLIFTKESLFSKNSFRFSSSLQPSPRTRVFLKIFNHILSSFGGSGINLMPPANEVFLAGQVSNVPASGIRGHKKDPTLVGHIFQTFQLLAGQVFQRSSFCWSGISKDPTLVGHAFQTFQLLVVRISNVPAFCWSYSKKIQHSLNISELPAGQVFQTFQLLLVRFSKDLVGHVFQTFQLNCFTNVPAPGQIRHCWLLFLQGISNVFCWSISKDPSLGSSSFLLQVKRSGGLAPVTF